MFIDVYRFWSSIGIIDVLRPAYLTSLIAEYFSLTLVFSYAPINGLPQDGGAGQPTGIRLRKVHLGGDFDSHNGPRVGNLTRPPS